MKSSYSDWKNFVKFQFVGMIAFFCGCNPMQPKTANATQMQPSATRIKNCVCCHKNHLFEVVFYLPDLPNTVAQQGCRIPATPLLHLIIFTLLFCNAASELIQQPHRFAKNEQCVLYVYIAVAIYIRGKQLDIRKIR